MTVNQFISDEGGIAVEIPTPFECIAEWKDAFWGAPLKGTIGFGFYQVEDRKFQRVKVALYTPGRFPDFSQGFYA